MIRLTRVAAVGALAAAAALSVRLAAQSPYDKVLSAADVSKVTGISGIRLVPQGSQVGAGGTLNFARPDGKLVLMVNLGPAELYRKARDSKELEIGGKKYPNLLFAHNVPGVGDEAFASPPGPVQYACTRAKATRGSPSPRTTQPLASTSSRS